MSIIKPDISECLVCSKPLGQDTKDLDYRVCLEHRTCTACGKPLSPGHIHLAHDRALEENVSLTVENLLHPRCVIANGHFAGLSNDPSLTIRQSTLNILNAARLMLEPDMNMSIAGNENEAMRASQAFCESLLTGEESFDSLYYHQKKLEACLAAVEIFIRKTDKTELKKRAAAREDAAIKKAKLEAKTSSRPVGKTEDDIIEVALADFMKTYAINERKQAIETKRRVDKAIEQWMKLGMPRAVAEKMAYDVLKKERGLS